MLLILDVLMRYFRTPLHGSLEVGDESMSNMLLKAGASVNAYDCEGRTPIMLAMDRGNRRLFSKIVEKKSNLDVLDKRGWNVVIYSIETQMLTDVYPLLRRLNKNASIILRARDPQGLNALHHAAQLANAELSTKCVQQLSNLDFQVGELGSACSQVAFGGFFAVFFGVFLMFFRCFSMTFPGFSCFFNLFRTSQ